jgi:hypothetical protein
MLDVDACQNSACWGAWRQHWSTSVWSQLWVFPWWSIPAPDFNGNRRLAACRCSGRYGDACRNSPIAMRLASWLNIRGGEKI